MLFSPESHVKSDFKGTCTVFINRKYLFIFFSIVWVLQRPNYFSAMTESAHWPALFFPRFWLECWTNSAGYLFVIIKVDLAVTFFLCTNLCCVLNNVL